MTDNLGRGLGVFYRASEERLFKQALEADEKGEYIEAFHLYMKVAEMRGDFKVKALNNAAVILAENGFTSRAVELLKEAAVEDPSNNDVKRNLETLEGEAEL